MIFKYINPTITSINHSNVPYIGPFCEKLQAGEIRGRGNERRGSRNWSSFLGPQLPAVQIFSRFVKKSNNLNNKTSGHTAAYEAMTANLSKQTMNCFFLIFAICYHLCTHL